MGEPDDTTNDDPDFDAFLGDGFLSIASEAKADAEADAERPTLPGDLPENKLDDPGDSEDQRPTIRPPATPDDNQAAQDDDLETLRTKTTAAAEQIAAAIGAKTPPLPEIVKIEPHPMPILTQSQSAEESPKIEVFDEAEIDLTEIDELESALLDEEDQ